MHTTFDRLIQKKMTITILEDLSVELFHEIFIYFQFHEVFNIFCNLNSRFAAIVQSSKNYQRGTTGRNIKAYSMLIRVKKNDVLIIINCWKKQPKFGHTFRSRVKFCSFKVNLRLNAEYESALSLQHKNCSSYRQAENCSHWSCIDLHVSRFEENIFCTIFQCS